MTDTPTTALKLNDIAPDPTPLTTGASPVTITVGPRLYEITTGGTAGSESVIIPLPTLPLASGTVNASLVGLRITFCLTTQTDPADKVVISVADNTFIDTAISGGIYIPEASGVSLSFEGAIVSFVWASDAWLIDSAFTDGNFDYNFQNGQTLTMGPTGPGANGAGIGTELYASNATSGSDHTGGDIIMRPGAGDGSGRWGVFQILNLATEDPLVVGALWNNGGVVNISAG